MIKGYKASYGGKCINLTYEVGKTYTFNGEIKICIRGFHFCKELKYVFDYYQNRKENDLIVFEIEVLGKVIDEYDKSVTDKIKIVRILDKKEYDAFLQICEYDVNNNLIYHKNSRGHEKWYEYDEKNNLIHFKDSDKFEKWYEYDKNNNFIYIRHRNQYKCWFEYDKNNNCIHFKDSTKYEDWQEYDENNNKIYLRNSRGYEEFMGYDKENNLVIYKNSNEKEYSITIEG